MAESSVCTTDDILVCSICLETFDTPKYLPCLHTFCEGCLSTYIASGFEIGQKSNMSCPICRQTVVVPEENVSPQDWAAQLPLNFLISGLMETQKVQRSNKLCMMCERLGAETMSKASYFCVECSDTLCDTCTKYHNSVKFQTKHEVKTIGAFSSEDLTANAFKNSCADHKNKSLELYCEDHEEPCCSMCVSIQHRKCDKVLSIVDAAKGFRSSQNAVLVKNDLENILKGSEAIIIYNKDHLKEIEAQHKDEQQKLEQICKDLISTVNTLERQRKDELSKTYSENKDKIEQVICIFEGCKHSVENEKAILEVCFDKASETQAMIEVNKIRKQIKQHKVLLEENMNYRRKYAIHVQVTDLPNVLLSNLQNALQVKCNVSECELKINSASVYSFNRFKSLGTNDSYWHMGDYKLTFQASSNISFFGILSYGPKTELEYEVKICLNYNNATLAKICKILKKEDAKEEIIKVKFDKPINLKAFTYYEVVINRTPPGIFHYGEEEHLTAESHGVTFTFQHGYYKGRGQIPGFLFLA